MKPENQFILHKATGSTAISVTYTVQRKLLLSAFSLALNAVGGASENFVISINDNEGAAYDYTVYAKDMVDVQYIVKTFSEPIPLFVGDIITVTYTNTNSKTYGLKLIGDIGEYR